VPLDQQDFRPTGIDRLLLEVNGPGFFPSFCDGSSGNPAVRLFAPEEEDGEKKRKG